jgi:hypothetical protein
VSKPVWNEAGLPGYQKQSAEVLKNLVNQFDQPEFIPLLSELFSKMLVISAEQNFDTKKKPQTMMPRNPKTTYFSAQHKAAYISHETLCKEWRLQRRPSDVNHLAKIEKLNSQHNLQSISREEEGQGKP